MWKQLVVTFLLGGTLGGVLVLIGSIPMLLMTGTILYPHHKLDNGVRLATACLFIGW